LSKQIILPVVYDGAAGTAGANGLMSAFPTIYIWTGSSTPPTRPATTSTYTWSTGAYTAPSGWSTEAPSNTTPGNFLWSITVPLNVSATTTTSTLDWTNTANPIRAIAYNGTDGINGTNGTNGLNGTRTAILDVYQWGATPPTSFPSGTSTYTWATGQFTAPASLNGWSLSPPTPVLGQNLYIARQIFSDTNTSATSSITWTVVTATPISAAGVDGQNGARTAYLEVYQWSATTPTTFPSGTSTYTWADGTFTAPGTPNSWSLTPGAATPGYALYACSVSYSDTNISATSTVTWSTSTAFVVGFAGNNGNNGSDGTNGTRTAVLEMYIWSAAAPTVFPSGNSTYTWSTGQFTTPGVANGWSIIPQAAILGQTLWVARVIYADTNVTATTSITWNATVAYAISAAGVDGNDGTNGTNGSRTAFLELYQWAAVLPTAFPAGNSTYTWADGSFTAPTTLNGWSLTPGSSSPGFFLFACSVRYTDNLTTTTSTVTWNTSNAYVIGASGNNGTNGTNGLNGTRTAILDVYQWSVNAPTTFPTGSSTYTWATGQYTAPSVLNGWSLTPPAAVLGQTLWLARTLYADSNVSATSSVTWNANTAVPAGASGSNGNPGQNGSRTAFLELYQWAASTPTTFPSDTSTYTWADGSFTIPTIPNGWSITPGSSSPGFFLYGCSVRYADILTTSTTTITWNTSNAYIVGVAGSNGTAGTNGSNGAATYVITRVANDSSAPTNAEVNTLLGRNPVAGDICTVSYNNFNNAAVYRYTTAWALFQTYITGSLIVQNTITGDKISANTISADKLSVDQLAAVSADTGDLNVTGTFTANTAAISNTTMTGSGGVLYSSGNFAFGNSSTNISFNGTQMTLNGNVVATGNINLNAVTLTSSAFTASNYRNTANATWQDAQTLTITTSGSQVYVSSSGNALLGDGLDGTDSVVYVPKFRLVRGSTELMQSSANNPAMSFSDTPTAGTYTYRLQVKTDVIGSPNTYAGISNRSLFAIETKR
jgi:hypothetical protein